jgi:hypothetical protein
MKTARFLLACVAASLLAACGTDTITAPITPATPARPHFDESVGPGDDGGDSLNTYGTGPTDCIPVLVVNADGSVTSKCQVSATSQMGTGS